MENPSAAEAQRRKMLDTSIPKLVTSMAVPTMIAMMITVIYNTADTYFVSQINKSASAGVGVVFSVMSVIQAIGFGLGMGSGSLISRCLGQQKKEDADRYASSAFFAALAAGALVEILGLCFLDPIMHLLGCSSTMLPYAEPYAKYILMGAPFTCATFVLNNGLRAEGRSRLAMWGTAAGGILNIALDPLFIFTFGLDTAGAALATVFSQLVSFIILLIQYVRRRTIVVISPRCAGRSWADYSLILATGAPTICRQGLGSVATAALNLQAVVYGDAAVAAITIANKVYMLVRNMVIGLGQGFQPVAGYNYGAGDRKRTRQAFSFACKAGTVMCLLFAVFIALFARSIMWWFCDDEQVVLIGEITLLFCCAVMPLLAFSTYVNQLYQSLGFKGPATFLASCRQGIFFLPALWILPIFLGVTGVEMAQPLADLLTFLISIPFLWIFYRKVLPYA